jgi:lysosomal acid lipase/cholesteryl ester hydrolase
MWWQVCRLVFNVIWIIAQAVVDKLTSVLPVPAAKRNVFILRNGQNRDNNAKSINDDELNARAMIKSRGFQVEEHHITTRDGFVLVAFRIPNQNGRPVFLMHGLHQSCEAFLTYDASRSLAFVLANAGFDVWLGNCRGNKYSCKHKHLKPHDSKYWDYSIDERAHHDIPRTIDYIIQHSSFDKCGYVGFSQGSAMGFAAFSSQKSVADKISHFIAISAAAKIRESQNAILRQLVQCSPDLIYLILGNKCAMDYVIFWSRVLPDGWFNKVVEASCRFLFGWDISNMHPDDRDTIFKTIYSYCSSKSVVHWFQIMKAGKFQMYDDYREHYSIPENHRGHVPPLYPLDRIHCPISVFYGKRDLGLIDIEKLMANLPSHAKAFSEEDYEHLDYIYARSAPQKVYPQIIEQLKNHSSW